MQVSTVFIFNKKPLVRLVHPALHIPDVVFPAKCVCRATFRGCNRCSQNTTCKAGDTNQQRKEWMLWPIKQINKQKTNNRNFLENLKLQQLLIPFEGKVMSLTEIWGEQPHTPETNQTVAACRPVLLQLMLGIMTALWLQRPSLPGSRSGKSQKQFLQGPHLPSRPRKRKSKQQVSLHPRWYRECETTTDRKRKNFKNHCFAKGRSTKGQSKTRTHTTRENGLI